MATPGDQQVHQSSPIQRLRPFGGWLAGVAAAVISTIIGAWLLADRPSDDGMPFTVAVETRHEQAFGWISPHELAQVPDRPGFTGDWDVWQAEWAAWLSEANTTPATSLEVTFTIQGTSEAEVTLTGLEVRVVERQPAIRGVLVLIPGGDPDPAAYRFVHANLDTDPPTLSPVVNEAFDFYAAEHEKRPIRFPYRVSISDAESFMVAANTEGCDCEFVVEVSWASQGRTGTYTVDDKGKPFHLSGTRNVTHTCPYEETAMGADRPEQCRPGRPG